jgi:signal transduction histidine kinase
VVLGLLASAVLRAIYRSQNCTSTLVVATHFCSLAGGGLSTTATLILWTLALVVFVALSIGVALWCMRPVQDLTAMVSRLGPQNLAERSPVSGGRDETNGLAVAVNDMMDRLAAGYEGQRSFAANASHELRTPLAVQRTLLEVSMANARTPDQIELLTEQLLATNERNERLIEGLLVLSESDRGLVSRTPQRLDLIAAEIVAAHQELAKKSSVSLLTDLSECTVLGERVLLERLVTNLVRNGIAYNIEEGEVLVRVATSPQLVVENTGNPIAGESIGGLFEPFRRGTADRTSHGGGAGLGLTIVRSICQAHDGSVRAEPGFRGGLRVEVWLPEAR